jgi:hypothetical protein
MSSGEPRRQADPLASIFTGYITYVLIAGGVGLILLIFLTLSGFGGPTTSTNTKPAEVDPLDEARETLDHDADVSACRAALDQINVALGSRTDVQRPTLDAAARERLTKDFGLKDDEKAELLSEVGADNYTMLDGWHLAGALLFRDVATHALEPEESGSNLPAPAPLERAVAAFNWAVREVRLADPTAVGLTPPQFVVRRGSGTPLERALVFLDLLDQLNAAGEDRGAKKEGDADRAPTLMGCLVFCDARKAPADPWACGVIVEGKPDVYLFDPRLGLPLPGEGGKGVATLAEICKKPDLLNQLKIDGAPAYDVTPDQAKTAELHLVRSLSALAPRMRQLQEKLLPPLRVSLAHDPNRGLDLLRTVAGGMDGVKPAVKVWSEGLLLLRRFLSPDEGGSDKGWPAPGFPLRALVGFTDPTDLALVQMQRYRLFQLQLAPWDVMPPLFHDLSKFPYGVGLGLRVREGYMMPFVRIAMEPQGPRDRLLRGDFDKAAGDLVGFAARMDQQQKRRLEAGTDQELTKAVNDWVEKARHAYAEQLRAQEKGSPTERDAADRAVDAVWKEAEPVQTLLEGASSVPGLAEVTYQLGLCKHERAEQEQARLDLLMRRPGAKVSPLEVEDVRTAWMDALGWWKKYGDDHPEESVNRPSSCPGRAAAVRQMRARALAMLGDWKGAAATYDDMTEPMSDLEKLAGRYRALQVRKEHGGEKQ